jgi:transportin-3
LLTALQAYSQGPRVIQTQLCLTLAGLALQLRNGEDPEWGDRVVAWMIDKFGKHAKDVGTLLEFLQVLAEEVINNQRIPIDNDHYRERTQILLTNSANDVLQILALYTQAEGITTNIQNAVFSCLTSWLKAGEISVQALMATPLFALSFDSLRNEELFDVGVEAVCDIINETQEVEDNAEAIQLIVPRLLPLKAELQKAAIEGDEDKVRGLCRVFVQAGETYYRLILRHTDVFYPIVEAIAECAAYQDLDIVQITFRFWYLLSTDVSKNRQEASAAAYLDLYTRLLDIIVKHLRFPDELDNWTGQQRDDFRSFRHYMGDTLKDCCHVLGSQACLARSLAMIHDAMSRGTNGSAAGSVQWQDLEAPLFSMRAMGAEANKHDDEVIPQIIDIIPSLPSHPKLNYAALLVISRYTEWVNYHPDRISNILSYISAGFTTGDSDVAAAAAQALNYLCQDCSEQLTPFLPQLHEFFQTFNDRLEPEDLISLSEAIAYILTALPEHDVPEALMLFTQPLLQTLLSISAQENPNKDDLRKAADRMEQIERFLRILCESSKPYVPESCSKTCQEAYNIIDVLLAKHGSIYFISERACGLLRRAIVYFGPVALSTIPALLSRMTDNFETTSFPAYIWIVGKCIDRYGKESTGELAVSLNSAYERISAKVFGLLEASPPSDMADILDDYIHTSSATIMAMPSSLLLSPVFEHAYRAALSAMHVYQSNVVNAALDFLREVIGHDSLAIPPPGVPNRNADGLPTGPAYSEAERQQMAQYAQSIRTAVEAQGSPTVTSLLQGLVSSFDSDTIPSVMTIFRILVVNFDTEKIKVWIQVATENLSISLVSLAEKERFLQSYMMALEARNLDGIKPALQGLYNASRKARERDRLDRQSGLVD